MLPKALPRHIEHVLHNVALAKPPVTAVDGPFSFDAASVDSSDGSAVNPSATAAATSKYACLVVEGNGRPGCRRWQNAAIRWHLNHGPALPLELLLVLAHRAASSPATCSLISTERRGPCSTSQARRQGARSTEEASQASTKMDTAAPRSAVARTNPRSAGESVGWGAYASYESRMGSGGTAIGGLAHPMMEASTAGTKSCMRMVVRLRTIHAHSRGGQVST
jgi:hypothetical protein